MPLEMCKGQILLEKGKKKNVFPFKHGSSLSYLFSLKHFSVLSLFSFSFYNSYAIFVLFSSSCLFQAFENCF